MDEKISEEPQADLVPWTIGDIALGIGAVIGFILLVAFCILIGTVLLIGVDALVDLGSQDILAFLESEGLLQQWLIMVLTGMVVAEGAMPLAAWLFSSVKYHRGWRALGFRSFNIKRASILVAVVLIVGISINLLYEWVLTSFGVEPPPALPSQFTQTGVSLAMVTLLAVLVAPIAEETFFRGFILGGIGKRFGYGWGVVVSALLFSLAHMQPGALLPIFILGLLLAWLYIKTGSIWPCILTHFAYNSIAVIIMII